MSSTLTARDLTFLGQIWQCLKSAPEVDLDKLSAIAGYKTRASTNTAYHRLKAKIMAVGDAAEDGEADAEDSVVPSPAAKKGRGKKAAPVKAEESEDEDDEADEAPAKLTASGRLPRAAAAAKFAVSKPVPAARPKMTRTTRASAKTNKLDVQMSESDEDVIKPVGKSRAIKRGLASEDDWTTVSNMIMKAAGVDPTVDNDDAPARPQGVKRSATQVPSDIDDFDVKRFKGDDDVVDSIETPAASDAASNAASFGDTVPSDTEVDLPQVTDVGELKPEVHDI